MVTVPEAIVYEDTVMVEFLDTFVAEVAVVCLFWPEGFTGNANVVQVVVVLD